MRRNSDKELRDYERHELTDPVSSRKARELRIRLGRPRPSDLILKKLPEEARIAFDKGEDWSDRIYLPHPSFAPGEPSELDVMWEPEGSGSPPEFYRRYYAEAYEVESPRFSYKERPAVIGETHVYSESNGIWEGLGSDERRDVDEMTVEDMYGPAPSGHHRSPDTRWLDRRMWMRSWEPYDEHVLDTGEDPIGAYGLDDATDRRRLARCRLRALLWSSTEPDEYFALVGDAGLKWCAERPGQWHSFNSSKRDDSRTVVDAGEAAMVLAELGEMLANPARWLRSNPSVSGLSLPDAYVALVVAEAIARGEDVKEFDFVEIPGGRKVSITQGILAAAAEISKERGYARVPEPAKPKRKAAKKTPRRKT